MESEWFLRSNSKRADLSPCWFFEGHSISPFLPIAPASPPPSRARRTLQQVPHAAEEVEGPVKPWLLRSEATAAAGVGAFVLLLVGSGWQRECRNPPPPPPPSPIGLIRPSTGPLERSPSIRRVVLPHAGPSSYLLEFWEWKPSIRTPSIRTPSIRRF